MKITAIMMVKDEADVIRHTIDNAFRQGIDDMIIMDNLSTDGTDGIIMGMAYSHYPIWLDIDHEVGYYQSKKMTALAGMAFEKGADIVVPIDADEYWTGIGGSLRDALVNCQADIIQIPLFNYFSTPSDIHDDNPFRRITHHDIKPAPLVKVAVRNIPGLVIHQGNHGASGKGSVYRQECAMIGHFPWRSPEQFETKVSNGSRAYAESNLPEEMGGHWRSYGRILEDHGSEALREHYEKWFTDPELETVDDPVWSKYV